MCSWCRKHSGHPKKSAVGRAGISWSSLTSQALVKHSQSASHDSALALQSSHNDSDIEMACHIC